MTTTQSTARDAFIADAKATASRAGLSVPERLAYVAAETARYDAQMASVTDMTATLAHILGIGREVDPFPPRQPRQRYLIGDRVVLSPHSRFRYGWTLYVAGPYWHTAVAVIGPEWNEGRWLGGPMWKRRGPVAICRWRRRGSWRGDRISARLAREFEAKYGSDD